MAARLGILLNLGKLSQLIVGRWHLLLKSPSTPLTVFCMLSNLVAFVMSTGLPSRYVELDPMVQPGLLSSLAKTEGIILGASIFIAVCVSQPHERVALQSLMAGYFTADAVNDIVLIFTGSWFLALQLAWVTAASLPVMSGVTSYRAARDSKPTEKGTTCRSA